MTFVPSSIRSCRATVTVGKAGLSVIEVSVLIKTFDAARQKHLCISLQQFWIVPVDYCQEKIVVISRVIFDSADDRGAVGVADFLRDHANRIGLSQPQRARKKVGAIV